MNRVRFLAFALTLLPMVAAEAASVTLVDFGSSAAANVYGLSGWNTPLKSANLSHTAVGGGGVRSVTDPGEYGDFRGVSGTQRRFSKGERIVVTWFNDSDETFLFTARVSFSDADEPSETAQDGNWYTMRRFADYRFTHSEIQPHGTAKTVFNIEDSGVHKTDGTWSLVNINLAIEWGSTYQKPFLVCDKIELLDDADIVPPGKPYGLSATTLSDSKIGFSWNAPSDNVGVVEYLVYMDGEVEQYAPIAADTCVLLESDRLYSFQVTALDAAGNESGLSDPVSASTLPFQGAPGLIRPGGFTYLGAFAVPEAYSYGGQAAAFRADGDGGSAGPSDGVPGSLFISNLNQAEYAHIGEISIPAPVVSTSSEISILNTAEELSPPVNIRPPNVESWEGLFEWRMGMTLVPGDGRLYSVWSDYYTVTEGKHASTACCDAADLQGARTGGWFLGPPDGPPLDAAVGEWLFATPQAWADLHAEGRNLVTGRCREGGLSGLGPTLYAFGRPGTVPPVAGTSLGLTTLLEYGPFVDSYAMRFPFAIDGYNLADDWKDAVWVGAGGQAVVALIGNKALGHNWYGYHGERMHHDWVIADVPYPEFYVTDPDGKGWRGHSRKPMMVLFDPADLAAAAAGSMRAWEPQPYAAFRFPPNGFFGTDRYIISATVDSGNRILYVVEFTGEPEGRLVVHAWRVDEVNAVPSVASGPCGFRLLQNHPNPFNPFTTIRFETAGSGRVRLHVTDAAGRTVRTLADGRFEAGVHSVRMDASGLASGVYVVRMEAEGFTASRKIAVVK